MEFMEHIDCLKRDLNGIYDWLIKFLFKVKKIDAGSINSMPFIYWKLLISLLAIGFFDWNFILGIESQMGKPARYILVTSRCWWLYLGDNCWMTQTSQSCRQHISSQISVTDIYVAREIFWDPRPSLLIIVNLF